MMGSYSVVLFSLLLISSVILFSSLGSSFADEVIATSTGFEDSTILELKNSKGNAASIDSVRIWVGSDNEFKSFKTEQGWLGKKQLNGVIEFKAQNQIKPGENVKFGVKTEIGNPTINWKALDSDGEVISSSSTITKSEILQDQPELNQPKIISIKEESNFRFIPEKPAANSNFRVIGENFVPNQSLEFYIGDELMESVKIDKNGKILFTSKTPNILNDERTEFTLRDSGGVEKSLSLRILQLENRKIADDIKLSLGNTPQQVKRGEIITLEGMATPNTTLTITSKFQDGKILNVDTIQAGFDGKWSYDNLFSPELELEIISIEIKDGKSIALRNIEVISAKLINLKSVESMYSAGDIVSMEGTAIPNQEMSIILEDAIGAEIISRTVSVGESGNVTFNMEIPRGAVEGTYVLLAFQGNEEGVTIFGIGQQPEPILIVRSLKLNFSTGEIAEISIQGPPNAQIGIILIDSADREKMSDSINLGPDGREIYKINTDELPTGAYTLNTKDALSSSSGSAVFTVGLTTGSGLISLQTTRDDYKQGDPVLILGNTGAINVLLDVTINDPNGAVIKKIETFSDRFGVFKIDNFRIPTDGAVGVWSVKAESGGNFNSFEFKVQAENTELNILTDKNEYSFGDFIYISGSGTKMSATVTMKIFDPDGYEIDELNITAKSNGEFQTIWQIIKSIVVGEYEISIDDGSSNASTKFRITE